VSLPQLGRHLALARRGGQTVLIWSDRHFLKFAAWPSLAIMIAITAIPFALTLALAFTNYDLVRYDDWRFIDFENFRIIGRTRQTTTIILNTVYLVVAATTLEAAFGLALAMLMAAKVRSIGLIRSLYLLPIMTSPIVVAMTWRAMFNNNAGWINYFLGVAHLPQPVWLGNPLLAMPAVIISDMWTGVPFMAILLLAGLLGVPEHIKEAAAIDGAGPLQIFRYIILPWIRPVMFVAALLKSLDLFRKFEGIAVLTSGGPGFASTTLNLHVYNTGLRYHQLGLAAAWGVVMMGVIGTSALVLYFALGRTR
jgi:multiple sugar transport system permease protein